MAKEPTPIEKTVRGILLLMQTMIREKAHGRIVITLRDGDIQLIEKLQTYLPQNLPES
jgi:hypothetical protein